MLCLFIYLFGFCLYQFDLNHEPSPLLCHLLYVKHDHEASPFLFFVIIVMHGHEANPLLCFVLCETS